MVFWGVLPSPPRILMGESAGGEGGSSPLIGLARRVRLRAHSNRLSVAVMVICEPGMWGARNGRPGCWRTSGSSGLRYGGMALAWCGWQAPRRLRSPLSHTVRRCGWKCLDFTQRIVSDYVWR